MKDVFRALGEALAENATLLVPGLADNLIEAGDQRTAGICRLLLLSGVKPPENLLRLHAFLPLKR